MRDYSTINSSFTRRKRNSLPPVINNNENVVNGQVNNVRETISKDKPIEIGTKRSPKRKALGDIKQGPLLKKSQPDLAQEKIDIKEEGKITTSGNECSEKEGKKIAILKTPAAKEVDDGDKGVEATNEGYASVTKLAQWLADRPFDSAKKVTVPSSCPAMHKTAPKMNDLNGTKKTLFTTGENHNTSKPNRVQLKSIASTLPPSANKVVKSKARVCLPSNSSVSFNIKQIKTDAEAVQATNEGYARVKDLSHWLAEKPFDKKKKVIVSKKGKNVLEKSLAFEPDQPIPTEYVIHKEITKYNNVSERKNWLKNEAFAKK